MIKFTDEEISLCKQVAEKHRKEIRKGDWAIQPDRANIPLLVVDTQMEYITLSLNYTATHDTACKSLTPLWTIFDCLEFLRERKPQLEFELLFQTGYETEPTKPHEWQLIFHWTEMILGKTPLEACLKAVLAVLEEGK